MQFPLADVVVEQVVRNCSSFESARERLEIGVAKRHPLGYEKEL